ncbi:MAG: DUF3560 domain-containing protein [Candidatus Marinimicrobia bacterium]|nr:DUF3560 domain-containing protein [Candidatus Neomarinimicrobiota bacterium]
MNKYKKYCPNVFVIESEENFNRGDVVDVETRYGKINEVIIYNRLFERDGKKYYSQIRADGFNIQERAKLKSEKYDNWADSAVKKSDQAYQASNKHSDFLSLGEPIKIGHHSENRHRKMIENANNNMGKSVELSNKADSHADKSEYWKSRENDINLSMPESIDFYAVKLETAKEKHTFLKKNPIERSHSYSLTYAKKDLNIAMKNYDTAVRLWSVEA